MQLLAWLIIDAIMKPFTIETGAPPHLTAVVLKPGMRMSDKKPTPAPIKVSCQRILIQACPVAVGPGAAVPVGGQS